MFSRSKPTFSVKWCHRLIQAGDTSMLPRIPDTTYTKPLQRVLLSFFAVCSLSVFHLSHSLCVRVFVCVCVREHAYGASMRYATPHPYAFLCSVHLLLHRTNTIRKTVVLSDQSLWLTIRHIVRSYTKMAPNGALAQLALRSVTSAYGSFTVR